MQITCKAPLSTVLCYQHTHFKRKWTSSLPVSISLRLNTCYSTYRNSQWLTFLCHIPKTRGYQKRCHFGFLGFPVFITSITLFPQLYKVVLIFFHSAENNEKLQRKCSVLGTENKKKKKPTKNPKCKADNCIEREQLRNGIIAVD